MTAEEITISEAVKRLENKYTGSYLLKLAKGGKIQGRQSGSIWLVSWPSIEAYVSVDHPRGGSVKGWKKRQKGAEAAEASPAQPDRPAAKPVIRVSHASEQLAEIQEARPAPAAESLKRSPLAPQEMSIDIEGAHITIDPLLPDLQRWMHAEAIKGDVTAWCDIRPYPDAHWPGAYAVDYYYDRKDRNKKGAMGRNQEERAQALMHLLRDRLTEALQAQGWQTLTKTPSGQTLWHYRP